VWLAIFILIILVGITENKNYDKLPMFSAIQFCNGTCTALTFFYIVMLWNLSVPLICSLQNNICRTALLSI